MLRCRRPVRVPLPATSVVKALTVLSALPEQTGLYMRRRADTYKMAAPHSLTWSMPLTDEERNAWVDAYIEAQSSKQPIQADHPCWWAIERFMDLRDLQEAEEAWTTLLQVLMRRPTERVLSLLAAGPLEDLIQYWGPNFIERIERAAWESTDFRALLNGVWESSTPDIWARVQKAASGYRPASLK